MAKKKPVIRSKKTGKRIVRRKAKKKVKSVSKRKKTTKKAKKTKKRKAKKKLKKGARIKRPARKKKLSAFEQRKAAIRDALNVAGDRVETRTRVPWVRVATERDGSIDGELRFPVKGYSDALKQLEKIEDSLVLPDGTWISVGYRLHWEQIPEERKAFYLEYWGAVPVASHPQLSESKGENFRTAIGKMHDGLKDKRMRPHEIFVRVSWTKYGKQPGRKGRKVKR